MCLAKVLLWKTAELWKAPGVFETQKVAYGAGRWAYRWRPRDLPKVFGQVAEGGWERGAQVGKGCSVQASATPIQMWLGSSLMSRLGGRKASPGRVPGASHKQQVLGQGRHGTETPWLSAPTPACCRIQSRLSLQPEAAWTHSHLTKLSLKWAESWLWHNTGCILGLSLIRFLLCKIQHFLSTYCVPGTFVHRLSLAPMTALGNYGVRHTEDSM